MKQDHEYFEEALELSKKTALSAPTGIFQSHLSSWIFRISTKYAHDNYDPNIMKPWDFSRQTLNSGGVLLYSVLGGKDTMFTKSSFWHTLGVGFSNEYQLYEGHAPSYITWHVFGTPDLEGFAYGREIRLPLQPTARYIDPVAELQYFESAYESPRSTAPFAVSQVVYVPDGTCIFFEEADRPGERIQDSNFINWDCFTFSSEKVGEN